MAVKSKVLIIGGTGYIGRRIVKASLAQGHETFILQRPDIGLDIDKLQMLLSFKKQGAHLIEGSFNDHQSLVDAVKQVDVVICTIAGTPFRGHEILLQLKLVEAIKEAGNIKRFLPSEFGMDVARMGHALEQGKETIVDKMKVRKAIEDAKIPFTYVSANLFAGYFMGNLGDSSTSLTPPKQNIVHTFGEGKVKAVFTDEDDIANYAIKAIDDPRTLNKTIYIRPPENILTQTQIVDMYEKLTGKKMQRIPIPENYFLASMEGKDYAYQAGVGHFYHFFYEGCLANFEVGEDEEASKLYPEIQYTRMEDYMKQYI